MGRSKIMIEYIVNSRNRHNTHIKRTFGVISKLNELVHLTGARCFMIVSNNRGDITETFSTFNSYDQAIGYIKEAAQNGYIESFGPSDFVPEYKTDKNGKKWLRYARKEDRKVSYVFKAEDRALGRKGTNKPKKETKPGEEDDPMMENNLRVPMKPAVEGRLTILKKQIFMRSANKKQESTSKTGMDIETKEVPIEKKEEPTPEPPKQTDVKPDKPAFDKKPIIIKDTSILQDQLRMAKARLEQCTIEMRGITLIPNMVETIIKLESVKHEAETGLNTIPPDYYSPSQYSPSALSQLPKQGTTNSSFDADIDNDLVLVQ